MKQISILSIIFFSLFFVNCHTVHKGNRKGQKNKTPHSDSIKVISKHFNNNPHSRIEWKIPVIKNKDKKYLRQGTAVRYSVTGKIAEKISYVMDKKEGKYFRYYSNGKIYQEQTYKNGILNGEGKLYNRQGNVIAKYEYLNGMPKSGLIEYTSKGKVKSDPELSIESKDELKTTGKYRLKFSLTGKGSERVKSVKYYQGQLYKGKYLRYKHLLPANKNRKKTGEIVIDLPPNSEFNHSLNIIAVAKTFSGLKLILQRPVNVHICKL